MVRRKWLPILIEHFNHLWASRHGMQHAMNWWRRWKQYVQEDGTCSDMRQTQLSAPCSTSLVASSSEKGETKRARIRVHGFLPTPVPTQRRSANSDLCTVRIFVKVACGRVWMLKNWSMSWSIHGKLHSAEIDFLNRPRLRLGRFKKSISALCNFPYESIKINDWSI